MVKADMNKDYYADLELPPTADIADIKKQYRKLALKWHPDRNVGREEEVRPRFVVIHEAMEVLTDPAQKQKYDTNRKRTSRYPGPSGVRGNPWQDVSSKFQPPPRRAAREPRQAPTASGASRYSNWAPPPNRSTRENTTEHAKAWERMRPSSSGGRPPAESPQPSPRRPTRSTDSQSMPRTASQKQRAEASFGSSTRRTGFVPASPMGDERPVSSSNYFTTKTHTSIFDVASAAAAAAKKNAQASQQTGGSGPTDPVSEQFGDGIFDQRQSTPYANQVGEKTRVFDNVNLSRARTVRDAFRRAQQNHAAEGSVPPRQRSASFGGDPSAKPRADDDDGNRGSHGGTHLHPDSAASGAAQRRAFETRSAPTSATFVDPHSSSSTVDSTKANAGAQPASAGQNGPSVFSFNIPKDTFDETSRTKPHPFMRNSADNINTRFAEAEKATGYQFNAGGPPREDDPLNAKRRFRDAPPRGRQPFSKGEANSSRPFADSVPNPEASQGQGSFDADAWAAKFGPEHFVPPPSGRASASPTRRTTRKPKGVKLTAGTAGLVDEEETSSEEKTRPNSAANVDSAASPMDIDDPPQVPAPQPSSTARNIPVEPSRKEWRAGDANGANPAAPRDGAANGVKPSAAVKPNAAGSEDSEEFLRSDMFANTEPFMKPQAGLNSFGDMKSSLPFESKPSARIPIKQPEAKPIHLPSVPRSPNPPAAFAISSLKPSATAWTKYVREFNAYMVDWSSFNGRFTDHFEARRRKVEETQKQGGFDWLGTQGDSGIDQYIRWLEEDRQIRQKWMAACEAHELSIREFQKHRQRMKQ